MNYQQSKAIFEAMDELEAYAKMYCLEVRKDHADYDHESATRYQDYVAVAKCKIFTMMEEANDLRS